MAGETTTLSSPVECEANKRGGKIYSAGINKCGPENRQSIRWTTRGKKRSKEPYLDNAYVDGSINTVVPNGKGGFTTYNYETGAIQTIVPNDKGGFNTYDFGPGTLDTIVPDKESGLDIYNYGR